MDMDEKLFFFLAGSVSLLLSIFYFIRDRRTCYILFLLLAAAGFFLFAVFLYPFVNIWDERFHALVARNLMNHPLMPTLYDDPVISMAYDRWDRYHIWLHKQPLFLWQIAMSFHLFGINEFALRFPSVLLGVLMVYGGIRSGELLGNKSIGFFTGFLMTTSYYLLELICGYQMLDQNDFTFLAYISLSIWTFLEYRFSGKKIWLVFTGLFSGFAILCKWLVGLLVYLIWGIYSLREKKYHLRNYAGFLFSLAITALVSVPWQILIFRWYPAEAKVAYTYNIDHLLVPLDGHEGSIWYHFSMMRDIYGWLMPILILPACGIFYKKSTDRNMAFSLIASTFFVYLFFTITQTKMPSFTTVVILPVFLAAAFLMDFLFKRIAGFTFTDTTFKRGVVLGFFLTVMAIFSLDLNSWSRKHSFLSQDTEYRRLLKINRTIFKKLELPHFYVLFNIKGRHTIEAMFYTGLPAYNFIPSEEQYRELKGKHREAAVFVADKNQLPEYMKNDPQLKILSDTLHAFE